MSKFCVLVTSGDNRKDIFDVCFANSERIWKDCPIPRYAGFTTPQPEQYGFKTLASYIADDWCKSVAAHIDALPDEHRYILLMVEDTLFMRPVDGNILIKAFMKMYWSGLYYLRLVPVRRSWPARIARAMSLPNNDFIGCILPDSPYYASTEMAIWERGYLRELLDRPGDAWSFEHHVSRHAHWAVQEPFLDQHQIVNKGRWNRRAARYLAEAAGCPSFAIAEEIKNIITKTRPLQTWSSFLRGEWQNLNFAFLGFTSVRFKRWLKSF